MASLNIRTLYDHYCKESYPLMQPSFAPQSLWHGLYTSMCSLFTHSLLFLACLPLLLIKRLPKPLDDFPVVGFYQQQWLDELDYIKSPIQQVGFAASRVVDGVRIMCSYNPLTRLLRNKYKNSKANACQCSLNEKCECENNSFTNTM